MLGAERPRGRGRSTEGDGSPDSPTPEEVSFDPTERVRARQPPGKSESTASRQGEVAARPGAPEQEVWCGGWWGVWPGRGWGGLGMSGVSAGEVRTSSAALRPFQVPAGGLPRSPLPRERPARLLINPTSRPFLPSGRSLRVRPQVCLPTLCAHSASFSSRAAFFFRRVCFLSALQSARQDEWRGLGVPSMVP